MCPIKERKYTMSIIRDLFFGDTLPGDLEEAFELGGKYKDLMAEKERAFEEIKDLEYIDSERFEAYVKAEEELSLYAESEAFKNGFTCAMKFMLEALST